QKELDKIIDQKPNERLLFVIPREWIYLSNAEPGDTSWLEKGMQNIGQPTVFYSEDKAKLTALDIQNYLLNEKGFFEVIVDFTVDEKNKVRSHTNSYGSWISTPNKVTVQYIIDTKERYIVKSIQYTSADSVISNIIQQNLA